MAKLAKLTVAQFFEVRGGLVSQGDAGGLGASSVSRERGGHVGNQDRRYPSSQNGRIFQGPA
jgi:hypothetical protein